MANNSKVGLYLGVFGALSLTGVLVYLAVRKKATKVPPRTQSGQPPRVGGNQSGQGTTAGAIFDILKDLFGGGKGKGGVTFGGGGASPSGGGVGTKPTTNPNTGNTAQGSSAWNNPNRYDSNLGGFVDPQTGEVWDRQGNYLGFVDDAGNFLEFDASSGYHYDNFGNVYDQEGGIIGYFSGDEFIPVDGSGGNQYNAETGDLWDAQGNYLGWYGDDGNFYSYNSDLDAYVSNNGGVYDENGEIMGWLDDSGFNEFTLTDEEYDLYGDEYFNMAIGGNKSEEKSKLVVVGNGRMLQTKVNRIVA